MIYKNHKQIKIELKKLFLENETTYDDVAQSLNTSRQNISRLINVNKNFSLETLNTILNTMGYDLEINFIKRK